MFIKFNALVLTSLVLCLSQCKEAQNHKLHIVVSNSGCVVNGIAVTTDSLAKIANGGSPDHGYGVVTVELSDDTEFRQLSAVIDELAAAGFGEIGVVSSSNKELSAEIELALSDHYQVHWQYATEVTRAHSMSKATGYDVEFDIAFVTIRLDGDKMRMGDNTVGEQEVSEFLKELRAQHERVAVRLVLEQSDHNIPMLIRILALVEKERCKTALSFGPD